MSSRVRVESLTKPAVLIPIGLFLAAFLFRLVGIGWGLPNDLHNQSYHPDETVNYGVAQSIDLAHGKLTPGFYNYGTAYFIAESIADKVVRAYGGSPDVQDPKGFWQSVGRGILVGRILNALAGAGAVVVIWLILGRMTTRFGALFGSALIGFAPGFVIHSRFETVDVFATFWLALSAFFALRMLGPMPGSLAIGVKDGSASGGEAPAGVANPSHLKDAILAGLFAGIATGTKYTSILVLVVLWVAIGLTRRPGWWKSALAGTAACFAAFVLTTPGFLFDSDRFWKGFEYEVGHSATGHGLVFAGTSSGYLYHFGNLVIGLGLMATVAGLAGLVLGSYRRHPWAIALLAFALVYYLVIGRAEVKFLRYTFPLLLPLAVGYGYAMGTAFRTKTRRGLAFAVIGVFALVGNPFFDPFGGLIGAVHNTYLMASQDPRDEAALYLKRVAANGSVGLVKDPWFYTPPLIPDAGLNRGQLKTIYEEIAQSSHPKVLRFMPSDGSAPVDWDVRLLTEAKPDYVVFSSFEVNDEERLTQVSGLDPGTQSLVDRYQEFKKELRKRYADRPVAFGGLIPEVHDLMYIRPTIWIWKRNDLP